MKDREHIETKILIEGFLGRVFRIILPATPIQSDE
jgi:hypothetical protein